MTRVDRAQQARSEAQHGLRSAEHLPSLRPDRSTKSLHRRGEVPDWASERDRARADQDDDPVLALTEPFSSGEQLRGPAPRPSAIFHRWAEKTFSAARGRRSFPSRSSAIRLGTSSGCGSRATSPPRRCSLRQNGSVALVDCRIYDERITLPLVTDRLYGGLPFDMTRTTCTPIAPGTVALKASQGPADDAMA